jgi:hypothetical protein
MPIWLSQADTLPHRNFITSSEKKLVDLVREQGETTKAGLITYTDYSRTKISSARSLLDKQRSSNRTTPVTTLEDVQPERATWSRLRHGYWSDEY